MAGHRLRAHKHLDEAERVDGLRLPLQGERFDGLQTDGIAYEEPRLSADEHLAGCRRLFEAGGDVHRVARDERLALSADHDLAGIHADAGIEPMRGHRFLHLRGRAYSPKCVVLVRDGDAEDGHDRIADELLDCASVPLEDCAQVLEVTAHTGAERLGIRRFAESRRADEVAEENSDHLAGLPLGLRKG